MAAVNQDIGLGADPYFSGDTLDLYVPVYKADGETLEDLSNATIAWSAWLKIGLPLISKATGNGITIVAGPDGEPNAAFKIAIAAADTAALEGLFWHEAQVTFTGGVVSTVLTGQWFISRDAIVD